MYNITLASTDTPMRRAKKKKRLGRDQETLQTPISDRYGCNVIHAYENVVFILNDTVYLPHTYSVYFY